MLPAEKHAMQCLPSLVLSCVSIFMLVLGEAHATQGLSSLSLA